MSISRHSTLTPNAVRGNFELIELTPCGDGDFWFIILRVVCLKAQHEEGVAWVVVSQTSIFQGIIISVRTRTSYPELLAATCPSFALSVSGSSLERYSKRYENASRAQSSPLYSSSIPTKLFAAQVPAVLEDGTANFASHCSLFLLAFYVISRSSKESLNLQRHVGQGVQVSL